MHHPRNIDHAHLFADEEVTSEERDRRMREIFRRLAPFYDRLIDVQSLGFHRYWRRVLVRTIAPRPGQRTLDEEVPDPGTPQKEIRQAVSAGLLPLREKTGCIEPAARLP